MKDEAIAALMTRFEKGQAIRAQLWQLEQTQGASEDKKKLLLDQMVELDRGNTTRLTEILEREGWPDVRVVGEEASKAVFLVLQHADLDTQVKFLPLLREATQAGAMKSTALPMLEDRVCMRQGRDQIYGSQLTRGANGEAMLWPIEDVAHVDERRARMGMEPLAEYLRRAGFPHLLPDVLAKMRPPEK